MSELDLHHTINIESARPSIAAVNPSRESRGSSRDWYGQAFEAGFKKTLVVVQRMGANFDLAEDLSQAAWTRGWERLPQLEEQDRVVEWVNSIAVRMFWDEITKNRRFTPLQTPGFDPQIAPSVNLSNIDVERAISPRQKQLLNAVYVEGQSGDQAAMSLGIASAAAVHHRLSRLRARLRCKLARA
jgi:DNA-directed RNA polymerase specialized sigma24 family protein